MKLIQVHPSASRVPTPPAARLVDAPEPVPGRGEVLLRLRAVAIGATELAVLSGRLPLDGTPGSEFTADVIHDPDDLLTGRRVIPRSSVPCGACGPCIDGNPAHCPVRFRPGRSGRHGGMAERFPFPRAGLVPLPPHIRDFDAISALPLASALRMAGRVPLPGRVLVVSDSGLGIVAACALRGRRQLIFLSMPAEEAVESVRKFSLHRDPGGRFPLVVAACDGPDVFARALDRVTPQGTLAVLGMPECTGPVLSLVGRELTVVGIDEGDVSEALTQLEDKESCEILSRARPTIFPLGQADQALAHATRPGSLRVILDNLA